MIVTDPVSDMLTRIRNANMVQREQVAMPASKLRAAIADILKREGYIDDFRIRDQSGEEARMRQLGGQRMLEIDLKYDGDRKPVIRGLKRVSKPGLRVYSKAAKVPRVMGGLGIAIISCSSGVMTDREARDKKVGGEVLCYVW